MTRPLHTPFRDHVLLRADGSAHSERIAEHYGRCALVTHNGDEWTFAIYDAGIDSMDAVDWDEARIAPVLSGRDGSLRRVERAARIGLLALGDGLSAPLAASLIESTVPLARPVSLA